MSLTPVSTNPDAPTMGSTLSAPDMAPGGTTSLKRRATSAALSDVDEVSRKKVKMAHNSALEALPENDAVVPIDGVALADDLGQELECGCCAAVIYRPVVIIPCQHFFCGSCCALWIKNGGTHCPSCRGTSISVMPSRVLEKMVDVLVRADPFRARSEREKAQADDIYAGGSLRIPYPREASPLPSIPASSEYARPCPHCLSGNPYGWRCTQPISDPDADLDNAWHLDDGPPPGHSFCGHCEDLMALDAPSSTRCDLCRVPFCGLNVPHRCVAAPLLSAHPAGYSDTGDLVQSATVYAAFDGNGHEVDLLLEHLGRTHTGPRDVYRDIARLLRASPRGFTPLFERGLFGDADPGAPEAPRSAVCRNCAAEVLIWGIRAWWVRERARGAIMSDVLARPDCPQGRACMRQQGDLAHAKEFNHIVEKVEEYFPSPPDTDAPMPPPLIAADSPTIVAAMVSAD